MSAGDSLMFNQTAFAILSPIPRIEDHFIIDILLPDYNMSIRPHFLNLPTTNSLNFAKNPRINRWLQA
jgi:hypothetical protein